MKVNSVGGGASCATPGSACPLTTLGRPLKGGLLLGTSWFLLIVAFQALAQDNEPTVFWKRLEEKGIYERLWEASRLYENEDNAVIQALSIVGRYQGQYWNVKAEQGNADGWENRRFFAGAEAVLFHDFTVQAQMKFSEDFDPIYDGLYVAFVKWAPAEAFSLSAGRLDFNYAGLEQTLSSTKIVTFERGQLCNQLWPQNQVVGTVAQGQLGAFSYRAGVFSGSIEEEFTTFAGGFGVVAGVGYALPLFYQAGSLHLDYLYNNGNPANNAFKPYDHIVSLWHQGQSGPFGLGVDVTAARGIEGNKSVLGVTVLPTYIFWKNVIRKGDALEAVLRFQYSVSDGDNGLLLQQRYEQEVVPSGRGNDYYAFYMGINYLIFGDRLKLMTGGEYSVMKDSALNDDTYNGWTYFAGVRLFF
jgi:phosphate-selective porin OprO/OprP